MIYKVPPFHYTNGTTAYFAANVFSAKKPESFLFQENNMAPDMYNSLSVITVSNSCDGKRSIQLFYFHRYSFCLISSISFLISENFPVGCCDHNKVISK